MLIVRRCLPISLIRVRLVSSDLAIRESDPYDRESVSRVSSVKVGHGGYR